MDNRISSDCQQECLSSNIKMCLQRIDTSIGIDWKATSSNKRCHSGMVRMKLSRRWRWHVRAYMYVTSTGHESRVPQFSYTNFICILADSRTIIFAFSATSWSLRLVQALAFFFYRICFTYFFSASSQDKIISVLLREFIFFLSVRHSKRWHLILLSR